MFVTVIIPIRNEQRFIAACLDSIIDGTYSGQLEILVVDGRSEDGTCAIVKQYEQLYPFLKLLDNVNKTVPYAMNIGIKNALGDVIVRVDAHALYPNNYIEKLVGALVNFEADNVGGCWNTVPASDAVISRATALILSHPFGVGNAHYRTGSSAPREVDTVPFGCYKKTVFETIGLYDEMLTRNQDDELNARLKRYGGKIVLIPEVKITYYARDNFTKMSKMLYQYGYFKPLVNIKAGGFATWRQLVPPFFVLTLLLLSAGSFFINYLLLVLASEVLLYFMANLLASVFISKKRGWDIFIFLLAGFFIAHVSYGAGYLRGILDFVLLKKHETKKIHITMSR
ncbi:MAG: glycosyltransferase family 2 protein [Chlorobium sp.]|nr:glycosyltransferase family 2 protein [Chlorobium sp.]